ncbi:TniQ family protein [Sphingomonas sanguinis]|jgi:hypothetical protein|uniref:TniQ family protein n=1 Tax=Sphingomonas sanguinis TaxID=33051 RepID=A0A7Y7QY14_9SPHN|nr:TniQ family protein [Sphingomonas sanguinis]MBZ6383501.1 TniQ family protein [Sphingomonas sanguinis]NNG51882.1 hypothetical protein [Sphingomonas sanguinis]NVP32795.1 TniQ family protein [Sphingomonas sanguinis]
MTAVALPIAPRPRPYELLSSWLARTAACYDVTASELRQILCPGIRQTGARPDVRWNRAEASAAASRLRIDTDVIMSLGLKRRWPKLAQNWLPSTDGTGRARGDIDLAWCHLCLAEGHADGQAYLDAETALPLIFCHRHRSWRQDFCRHCRPYHAPRFAWLGRIELVCSDCGVPLRANIWNGPRPATDSPPEQTSEAMDHLIAFDGEFRRALLGRPACLPGVGRVAARQFLTVLRDLSQALLAPDMFRSSRTNFFNSPLVPNMPDHEPRTWEERPFQELHPLHRAHVACAVIALLSNEQISRLMSGSRPVHDWLSLEWLLNSTPKWVQATLIRNSIDWPMPLRVRVEAHHSRTGMDAEDILSQFRAWRAELDHRESERVSLIG